MKQLLSEFSKFSTQGNMHKQFVSTYLHHVCMCVYVCVSVIQSCLTLCNPMDYSPPSSSAHGTVRREYWSGLPCTPPGNSS